MFCKAHTHILTHTQTHTEAQATAKATICFQFSQWSARNDRFFFLPSSISLVCSFDFPTKFANLAEETLLLRERHKTKQKKVTSFSFILVKHTNEG